MVLTAHLDPVTEANGTRRADRRALRLQTSGTPDSGRGSNVTVHNISPSGLLLETEMPLAHGESLRVDLPNAGAVEAQIVWSSGQFFGCAFVDALTGADLSAVQLKADSASSNAAIVAPHTPQNRAEPLGIKLNRLRREQGKTLAEIANWLGVSKPTVWAWEKGKAKPIPERYEAIAAALGVDVVEIRDVAPHHDAEPVIEESRIRIAQLYGVHANKVRIMIDL